MCDGCVRCILLLPLVARCFMSVVGVCGNVCCVAAVVKDSGYFSLRVLNVMNVVFFVCIVMRGAVGARVWEV